MDLEVDVEDGTIFLEGATFLIPLSEQQARQLADWLERAASQVCELARRVEDERS